MHHRSISVWKAILTAAQRQKKTSLKMNCPTSRLQSCGRTKSSKEKQQSDRSLLHLGELQWDALIDLLESSVGLARKLISMPLATVEVSTEASYQCCRLYTLRLVKYSLFYLSN